MYEIVIELPFNGFKVKGILSLPVQARDLIIFSHGFGRFMTTPHEHHLALKFQQEGYGTLVFDLLDEHDELPSDYKNIDLLSRGLLTSTNWLHNHSEYSSLNLAYFGSGTGAATAIKAAAKLGNTIKTVVSLSGRLDLASKELAKIECPVLLIVGELDFQTVNINQHALQRLKTKNQLAVVPGASHLFEEPDKINKAANITVSWFKKYLSKDKRQSLSH